MRTFSRSLVVAVLCSAVGWSPAAGQCGGICSYEVGSSHIGSAYAGASATVRDASTAYLNPAGLTALESDQVVLGGIGVFSNRRFTPSEGSGPGLDGGGRLADPLGSYGVYSAIAATDRLSFGLAMNFPYGGDLSYADSFVGRSYVTDVFFVGTNLQPTLAYEIVDGVSVGGAINVLNFRLDQDLITTIDGFGDTRTSIRRADDWSVGFTVGVLLERELAGGRTRAAFVYRNGFDVGLRGGTQTTIPGQPQVTSGTFQAGFDLPRGVNFGLNRQVTDAVALFADLGWSDWSQYSGQTAAFNGAPVTRSKDQSIRDWRDTWRLGIGGEYRVADELRASSGDALHLEAGFSWDSSPVKSFNRLPDVPIGNVFRVSAGLRYAVFPWLDAALGYTFLSLDEARVNDVELPAVGGGTTTIDGRYGPNHASLVGLTLTSKFSLSLAAASPGRTPAPI